MKRFTVVDLPLAGLKLIERQRLSDARGYLSRLFCAEELSYAGWNTPIVQVNHVYTSRQGCVRGFHFQRRPHEEMKLVNCLRGEVWDVAVDVRADSPTFLRWHAEILSGDNRRALLLPEGVAHGFQALTPDVELLYCHSAGYAPQCESGLNPLDPRLAIPWPLEIYDLSERDASSPFLTDAFEGVVF